MSNKKAAMSSQYPKNNIHIYSQYTKSDIYIYGPFLFLKNTSTKFISIIFIQTHSTGS